MRPLVFLDFDDVICLNSPYGGYDVFAPDRPADLWERLFHPPAVETLLQVLDRFAPHVVLTTSWLRLMDRAGFVEVLERTGLARVAAALHPAAWEAPPLVGQSRADAIGAWLAQHHAGEPFVILDDALSGTGLAGSPLLAAGTVVLCEVDIGLHAGHVDRIARALEGPAVGS